MNCIYRLVWSDQDQALRAVAETARGRRKCSGSAVRAKIAAALASLAACGVAVAGGAPPVNALPTAPTVVAGQASVTSKGNQMQITESTTSAIINWGSFNIGLAASVNVVQPGASSVLLNRVLSPDASQIYGSLTSNGAVFLVNPQGVIFGRGAQVNVGALVASGLDISNQDFLAHNWNFNGAAGGTVSNAGSIQVAPGGFAALIGGHADNTGSISARLGSVAIAAGNAVSLDLDESGLLRVGISRSALDAQVTNGGAIIADGGRIVLTAKAAGDLLGNVVNNTGLLQAQGIGVHEGQVWLLAADPLANTGSTGAAANGGAVQGAAGGVSTSGTIDVSGQNGSVTLAGSRVDITGAINASGSGGRVLANSTTQTTLAAGGSIDVSGDSGHAVLWSDGATTAHGAVDGQGTGAGHGATVEVSSSGTLTFDAQVDLAAATPAQAGTLVLDPATLEIAAGAGVASANVVYQNALQVQSGNVVLSATGQVTIDALNGNALNLANATGLTITSDATGGIRFLNNAGGQPSAIVTHDAPVSLIASGSGSIDNVGTITTNGGNIDLSGVYVHLAGGLNATNGAGAAGNVTVSVFGGGLLSSSTSPIAGADVTLDATYGYAGTAQAPIPTSTANLAVLTGGNAYVSDTAALASLALTSNHLEGTPVGIGITASNLNLTGADGAGTGTTYSGAVRWTQFNASVPASATGPASVTISEDGNLLPGNINLPTSTVTLSSRQGYIVGGNAQPVIAAVLDLNSPLGIGGTDFNGINAETDGANPGAAGGNTLLIRAGTVQADVLDSTGAIAGIANISQQGNLVGSVEASAALVQATGAIGTSSQHFQVDVGNTGEVYNAAAGGNAALDLHYTQGLTVANAQAGGTLLVDAISATNANGAVFEQVTAGGNATLSGTNNPSLVVQSIASTSGSIAVTGDQNLEVDAATLNGTSSASRSIALTATTGSVIYGALSTNGPIASTAAAPIGAITIDAPQGYIYDLSAASLAGTAELRAGSATLNALYGIQAYNTAVDAATALSLADGQINGWANTYAILHGVSSVSDPAGAQPHAVHVVDATNISGDTYIANTNGDLRIGQVNSYWDYGSGYTYTYGANLALSASGSIVPDGSVGGGAINAGDYYGNIDLSAGGSLGKRGTGAGGLTGAGFLELNGTGNTMRFTTGGDLFVHNTLNQGEATYYETVNIAANYASATTPYFYHFQSGSAGNIQAGTPTVAFDGSSAGGLLTISHGSIDSAGDSVSFTGDGNLRISSFDIGNSAGVTISAQNITLDPQPGATPLFTVGDNSNLTLDAAGSLNVGSLASGSSNLTLNAQAGNLTLGKVGGNSSNVNVYDAGGDILGAAGNRVLAYNLTLSNTSGAIGADPSVAGSIPVELGVANQLALYTNGSSTSTGGGSINLATLNDPASLVLSLYVPSAGTYAGAHFSFAPVTTGLGFSGYADSSGITLQTLGTTGTNPAAVPVSLTVDTPRIDIASGSGPQQGIGYDLYFGGSNASVVTNLSGSAGQLVTVHADSNGYLTSLTGTLALTNLYLPTNTLSSGPLAINYTLAQPLSVLDLTRSSWTGNDLAYYPGNSLTLAGAGQSISVVESMSGGGGQPGTVQFDATSASSLAIFYSFNQAGTINLGNVALGGASALTIGAYSSGSYGSSLGSAITMTPGATASAATMDLTATSNQPGEAALGSVANPLSLDAATVNLTTTGDINASTSAALRSLSIVSSHPNWANTGASGDVTYAITGPALSLSLQDTGFQQTALTSLTASVPLSFSLTTDASITVGSVNAGPNGTVNLTSNAGYVSGSAGTTSAQTGIYQGSGSGITAGTVNLTAVGYQGSVGGASALAVATPNLDLSFKGVMNVADASALQTLALTVGQQPIIGTNQFGTNTYTLTAPNIAFAMTDASSWYWNSSIDLVNLASTTLTSFSLTTTYGNVVLGSFNGTDYSGGQINLGSGGSVTINSGGSIWGSPGYFNGLPDQANSPVAASAAAVVAGSLALNAGGSILENPYSGASSAQQSIPVEVASLSASGNYVALTTIGSVDITSANTVSGYFRAIESTPATAASITGGGTAPLTGTSSLALVAYYGSIGQGSGAPVVVNTPALDVESGADIAVHDTGSLSTLSITSNHNKAAVNDTSNGGLNTLAISDSGSGAMQLGATDLGMGGGGYQITGMNAPALTNLSFTSDSSISVGSIVVGNALTNPGSVAITSTGGSILQVSGDPGQVSAQSVTLTAATTGDSVGLPGSAVRVDTPNLTVHTGGNLVIADSADLGSFALYLGAVTDAGGSPTYTLDNSAASHPVTMNLTGDTVNNVLDINSITVTRTDAPVTLTFGATGSSVGLGAIADNATAGGTVNVTSNSGNVFGLGGVTNATNVNLWGGGSVGDDTAGNAAPVNLNGQTIAVTTFGDLRIVSPGTVGTFNLTEGSAGYASGTWSVTSQGFTLAAHALNTGAGAALDITSVQDTAATSLSVNASPSLQLGTLSMGTGTLALASNGTMDSDGSNGATPNITSAAGVTLNTSNGIGGTAQITTDVAGVVNLGTTLGGISIDQTSTTPLTIGSLGIGYYWVGNSPVTISAAGTVNFTQNIGGGTNSSSPFTVTAGGDVDLNGSLQLYSAPLSVTAGGAVNFGNVYSASSISITAAGTLGVGELDPQNLNQGPASGPITLQAGGDINLYGHVNSSAGVTITSTNGSIFGQGGGIFAQSADVTLIAAGDIGSGTSAGFGAMQLNGAYCANPMACNSSAFTPLNLSVQAGGRVDLVAYSAVNATSLVAGGDLNLQVLGDPWYSVNAGIAVGNVQSTGGSVTLGTYQGSITAANGGGTVSAATSINLSAYQSAPWWNVNWVANPNVYSIGAAGAPLVLNAPQVSLTANGDIYAQVPTTGLTDLTVARTIVPAGGIANASNLGTWMPGGTISVVDASSQTVLAVTDTGWAPGGSSTVTANYVSALNLSYTAYDAIVLGNVNLSGGNLSLGVYNPSNISITSQGGLIQANNFNFSLNDTSGTGSASGGFGTAGSPIQTQITSLSGSTVGANAGVFIDQTGPITFTNLVTGGDIAITTTVGGAGNSGAVYIGNVVSNGGSVSINAAGPISEAAGVSAPAISAAGPAGDGGVTLQAGGAIGLPNTAITSGNAAVSLTTTAGDIAYGSVLAAGSVAIYSAAGITGLATTSQAGNIDMTANAGNLQFASMLASGGTVTLIANAQILGTAPAQNLTGLPNGITASGMITLAAADSLGTAAVPLAIDQTASGTIDLTSGAGFDTHVVLGAAGAGGSATLNAWSGGTLDLANYYPSVLLDNVFSTGNLTFTQLSNHGQVLINQVSATGPGAVATFDVPYGDISASSSSSQLLASRVVLNALGDATGGTIGAVNAVDENANVVLAVASGDITLNSLASGATKMPLVASNGATPTVTITSGGDFLVGQVVAGQQGTVNITSAANIYDDQDSTTRIYAGTIDLQAAGAIGTSVNPVQTSAQTYGASGAAQPGTISATASAAGNITLDQQGDAVFSTLTTANGSINVTVHDQAGGLSTLTLANTAATDATGNDIVVNVSNGNLAVDQAIAGLNHGVVTLTATQGSLYGIAQVDCCVTPNVVGSVADLTALHDVGQITNFAAFTGTPIAIEAGQSTVTSTANAAQVFVQYTGNAVVGPSTSLQVNASGTGDHVIVAACGNLTVDALSLPNASLGLMAVAGSVLDGVGAGSSAGSPVATAAAVNVKASASVGDATDALWFNTSAISADAAGGGVWIDSAASTPVALGTVTAAGGPVVINAQGSLQVGTVNAGTGNVTLASAAGSVTDGTGGTANAGTPNVTGRNLVIASVGGVGGASDALWVDAATISASASAGGAWINSAAATPVTLASITAGGGPVMVSGQGDLLIGSIDAGLQAVTLTSIAGVLQDGTGGTATAGAPNVTAGTFTGTAHGNVGSAATPLWVDADTINATSATGGVWINSVDTTPVTLGTVNATSGGPVVITGPGDLVVGTVNAGSGDVALTSTGGAILDGIPGGSSQANPNITAGNTVLNAKTTVGVATDPLWIEPGTFTVTAPGGHWINVPTLVLTPYPYLPLIPGVSPTTVFSANAQSQTGPAQDLPITPVGLPMQLVPPIEVGTTTFGLALPEGNSSVAAEQDASMGTASAPIEGGNEDELGRKKLTLKKKTESDLIDNKTRP